MQMTKHSKRQANGSCETVRTLTLVASLGAGQNGVAKFSNFQSRTHDSTKDFSRELQQVIDLVPQHIFLLDPDFSASLRIARLATTSDH